MTTETSGVLVALACAPVFINAPTGTADPAPIRSVKAGHAVPIPLAMAGEAALIAEFALALGTVTE